MKILAVADFHGASNAENNLSKFIERGCDCLVLIGDLTDFGPPEVAESILERVKAAGVPTFVVPGNCDPKQILQVLDKYGVNLHGKCEKVGDIAFIGLGGSNLTPFNTPFELTEVEIQEELAAARCNIENRLVLITHAPPYGTKVDQTRGGIHVGSKSIRQYIEQKQPLVSLCGHVHEARGVDELGRTLIVNPGQISKGFAAEVVISNKRKTSARLLEL
ncbi:MAG: metallophosphoesterase family protein [Hadesarchaea archaeon]|nr:metallophosphoesterase family protein [Hadesarchaea archaeon]